MRTLVMFAVLAVAVPDRPDPTPKEAKPLAEQLQGHWQITASFIDGVAFPLGGYYLIDGKRMMYFEKGKTRDESTTYTIDVTKKPATIDVISKIGDMDVKEMGIFKIEGDVLTTCWPFQSGNRPTQFELDPKKHSALMQMKRIKK
jgi:uncharacterized protein (TIGR03067 family)